MSRRLSRQRRRAVTPLLTTAPAAFRYTAVLLGAVLLSAMAGCSAPATELGADTAKALQAQVFAVTEAAAVEDRDGSLRLLDELEVQLEQAAAGGGVSSQRHQSIRTAIGAVRAELNAQQAAAEQAAAERAAAEQAAAAKAAAEQATAEQSAAEQKAAEQAAVPPPAVVAPAPAPADSDKAKGKGPDNGKGPDKG